MNAKMSAKKVSASKVQTNGSSELAPKSTFKLFAFVWLKIDKIEQNMEIKCVRFSALCKSRKQTVLKWLFKIKKRRRTTFDLNSRLLTDRKLYLTLIRNRKRLIGKHNQTGLDGTNETKCIKEWNERKENRNKTFVSWLHFKVESKSRNWA